MSEVCHLSGVKQDITKDNEISLRFQQKFRMKYEQNYYNFLTLS